MRIQPGRLGFDIDGVVADTVEAFIRLAREDHGLVGIEADQITDFMVEDCLDVDPGIIQAIFQRILDEPLAVALKPISQAREVLTALAADAPLTFITARAEADPIAAWLETVLGPAAFRPARLVATGDHDAKTAHIKDMGLTHFVDDRAETCLALRAAGIRPLVFDQPWNRGRHDLPVVTGWPAIHALCYP
ncbi:MAG: hypothetical protein AB1634_12985 [Thermodesulfobacteriota bacterium]